MIGDGAPPRDESPYRESERWLERAERTIPLGSQTFSKSRTQFPHGVSPYFIERSQGAWCWDADGRRYADFINGLLSVSLGHRDPDVEAAVADQLADGVTHSLSHRLEYEVAERIVELVPCAEMVRFGKNGSDATTAAVRLARAITNRDLVAQCGYHGWQDWSIGTTTRDLGVPSAVRELSLSFPFDDLDALQRLFDENAGRIAAVVIEPMNIDYPSDGYLSAVAELTRQQGALLIFDETITGFRFARGGAQELFGVTPDLATFGKGLANGFPLSAIAGSAELMRWMERIFFSTTFGGETLSLAAARAVLDKLRREPVLERIAEVGTKIEREVTARIDAHGLAGRMRISGHPSWTFLRIDEREDGPTSWELKTLLLQEMHTAGVLMLGTHNVSAAHDEEAVDTLLRGYDVAFAAIAEAEARRSVDGLLRCEPLQPLFRVR